ncbi:MAG: aminotransferase class I/II-fold pyridoxal phosphate-dependent enzyme [Phycisphaeraceae bacterium]|nr:MAG: aminotransferase class I/II-fold pyridoxal phosphate-dependent enzyme [Phycisphaeraceae bacterium]
MDLAPKLSDRTLAINGSGIRRVFEIGATIPPDRRIDLSIGQPDFPVPQVIKDAAAHAIQNNRNGYPLTRGIPELRESISRRLRWDLGWSVANGPDAAPDDPGLLVTSGTSGGLILACMALLNPGDEVIIPDPYFVIYPYMASLIGGRAVACSTYPDFRLTAARVEPLITPRTKMVVLNSPSNPAGVVSTAREAADLLDLCRRRGLVLLSDEIYDEFTYADGRSQPAAGRPGTLLCPSPARETDAHHHTLVLRGFGKTYGVTGWRLGYAAGPRRLIDEMTKLQQYIYVSSPHPLQAGVAAALDLDMSSHVAEYQRRRDLVVSALSPHTDVPTPAGAFYAFVRVPDRFGDEQTRGETFFRKAVERGVLVVPGRTFSGRDTHVRLSYATPIDRLTRGLEILAELLRAG